ncbi:MAG: ribosome small subunit-dependent GTPase A [Candidatus Thiodiazotropha sp.]
MHIHNLTELGWSQFFQSQIPYDALDSQYPFRVVSVQRNLIECLGFDTDRQARQIPLSTYHWRNDPPEEHPTIGDWVLLDAAHQPLTRLNRKSLIKRRGAGRESLVQLIAANIDTAFIVTSCNEEFSINRVERYLAIAAESGIHSVVVLTKIDLCPDTSPYLDALVQAQPGLSVETVNATDALGLAVLRPWIGPGDTVALLGSSGVGKSTLINGLMGQSDQATSSIREADSKGRHTTTSRSLHLLPDGGLLIDNPGMRELQISDSETGLSATFADIEALARQCRFGDCRHGSEPGCAVIAAIEAGQLEQRRLDNYLKLQSEQARNSASLAERRSSDRALGRFYKQALKSSKRFKSRE